MGDHVTLSIRTGTGVGTQVVPVTARVGGLVVHPRWRRAGDGAGWTVTHAGTGYAVWHVETLEQALLVARELDRWQLIPESADEAWTWRSTLSPAALDGIRDRLAAIAPHYVPAVEGG